MSKSNTKSIIFSLGMVAFLAVAVMLIPARANANDNVYGGNGNVVWCGNCVIPNDINQNQNPPTNPKPEINSVSPNSSNLGVGTKTITIVGSGFVPNSIGRINGSNRPTTFIDSSHLLMQITGSDTSKYLSNGGFYITVFNPGPGGGYSNAAFFKINKTFVSATSTTNANASDTSTNFIDTPLIDDGSAADEDFSNLASNAIFGSNSFYPSGLIQWIFFAILILLIVILVRRVYGADKRYHLKPMKHD